MPQSAEVYYTQSEITRLCELLYGNDRLRFDTMTKTNSDTGLREGLVIELKGDAALAAPAAHALREVLAPLAKSAGVTVMHGNHFVTLDSPTTAHPGYTLFVYAMEKRMVQEWIDKAIIPAVSQALENLGLSQNALAITRKENKEFGLDTISVDYSGEDREAWTALIEETKKYNAIDMNRISADDLKRWIVPFVCKDDHMEAPYKAMAGFLSSLLKSSGRPVPHGFETLKPQHL